MPLQYDSAFHTSMLAFCIRWDRPACFVAAHIELAKDCCPHWSANMLIGKRGGRGGGEARQIDLVRGSVQYLANECSKLPKICTYGLQQLVRSVLGEGKWPCPSMRPQVGGSAFRSTAAARLGGHGMAGG